MNSYFRKYPSSHEWGSMSDQTHRSREYFPCKRNLVACSFLFKFIVATLFLLFVVPYSLCQPKIIIRGGTQLHLGTIYQGDQVSISGVVANGGTKNLNIERVIASCSCTKPEIGSRILRPGDSTRFRITYDSRHAPLGHVEKSVEIVSNDVHRHTTTLKVDVDVIVDIVVQPSMLTFNEMPVDSFCVRSLLLTNRTRDTIRVKQILDSLGQLLLSLESNNLFPGDSLHVTALMPMTGHPLVSGTIDIMTDSKIRPRLKVNYFVLRKKKTVR